ncbi:MAG: NAD-dependent epimerase/dehydratase family protein [Flavobacteriales bacterium]
MNFITGGIGIVGSRLIYDLLLSGEKVRALKRKESNLDTFHKIIRFYSGDQHILDNLEWMEGDINDILSLEEGMKDCSYVYHCAAAVSFFKNDKDRMFKINVEGTRNVVNTALKCNIKKLCYVSSTAALGGSEVNGLITEEALWQDEKGRSNYAISKKLAELEVWRGIEEGLNAVIVNPSVILGPGDKSSSTLFTKVNKGLRFYTHGVNGYVDVRDVSNIMIKLMHSDISGERFLAISENISFRELFDSIAEHLHKQAPTIEAKRWMAEIIWRLEALRSALFNTPAFVTKETSASAFSSSRYSNEKARARLNHKFIPVFTSIKEISRFYKN